MAARVHHSHYVALDAGRGVAAIAVLLYHAGIVSGLGWLPRSYLAVDYFFVISGLVMAGAYEDQLRSGQLTLASFLRLRILRLAPCALLGMSLGVFERMAAGQAVLLSEWPNLLLLPAIGLTMLYPLNAPVWSLAMEVCANVLHATVLTRMGRGAITFALSLVAVCLLYMLAVYRNVNVGAFSAQTPWALVRVLFGYIAGIMFWRYLPYRPRDGAWLSLCALMVALVGVVPVPELMIVTASLFLLFPVALVAGLAPIVPGAARRTFLWLGAISYPLYAIHYPLLLLGRDVLGLDDAASWAVLSAFIVAAAWMADRWFDRPLRRWLKNWRLARQRASPA